MPICLLYKFEKIIPNLLFKYLDDHNLLSSNQPGFSAGDS